MKVETNTTRKENDTLSDTIYSLKEELKEMKVSNEQTKAEYIRANSEQKKALDGIKDQLKKERRKNSEERGLSVEADSKLKKVKQGLLDRRSKSKRNDGGSRILVLGELSGSGTESEIDTDNNDDELRDDEEYESSEPERAERPEPRRKGKKKFKPHEIKAMIDSSVVWPKYSETYDHDDFLQKCRRRARKAVGRGVPKKSVAQSLNVHIEKNVPEIRERYEHLCGDDKKDPSLQRTLEILQACNVDDSRERIAISIGARQASGEHEENFIERCAKRYDENIIPKSEEERIREIKKQFFNGLRWKPRGFMLEASMATCMDLQIVAATTRKMIADAKCMVRERQRNRITSPCTRRRENRTASLEGLDQLVPYDIDIAAVEDEDEEEKEKQEMIREMEEMAAEDARRKQKQQEARQEEERKRQEQQRQVRFSEQPISTQRPRNGPDTVCSNCRCHEYRVEHNNERIAQNGPRPVQQQRGRNIGYHQNQGQMQNRNRWPVSNGEAHFYANLSATQNGNYSNFNRNNNNGYNNNNNNNRYNNNNNGGSNNYNNNRAYNGNSNNYNNGYNFGRRNNGYSNQNNSYGQGQQQNAARYDRANWKQGGAVNQGQQAKQEVAKEQEPQGAAGNTIGGFEPAMQLHQINKQNQE